jgi:glycosyltransferase involved in cell wall biosynthesis
MAGILKKCSRVGLIVVGEGPEQKKLKLKTNKLELEANVVFEPWNNDPISYFKTADLFAISSDYEGTSMAMIEAMAVGCPIVITEVSGTGDILKHKESGLVVPVGDTQAFKEAILYLIENRAQAKTLGENAAAATAALPDKNDYLQKYKKSWVDVLSSKK